MADAWDDVASDPGFRALSAHDQNAVRLDFFDKVIKPNVPEEHHDVARDAFFRDTQPAPVVDPGRQMLEMLTHKFGGADAVEAAVNNPLAQQMMQGAAKGSTMGKAAGIPGTPAPAGIPQHLARLAGEIGGGAGIGMGLGTLAPAIAPAAEFAAGSLPEAVPPLLRAAVAPAIEGAGLGGVYGAARASSEAQGTAEPGDVGRGMVGGFAVGGGAGGVLGGAFAAIKAKFPGLFASAAEAQASPATPLPGQPDPLIEMAKSPAGLPEGPAPTAMPGPSAAGLSVQPTGLPGVLKDVGPDSAAAAAAQPDITPEPAPAVAAAPPASPPDVPPTAGAGAPLPAGSTPPAGMPMPRELGFDTLTPIGRAGNYQIEKMGVPRESIQRLQQLAADNQGTMDAARRGSMTFEQIRDLASKDPATVDQVISGWKPGQPMSAERLDLVKSMLAAKSQERLDAMRRISGVPGVAPPDDSTAAHLLFQRATSQEYSLMQMVQGGKAELGRGLSAQRMITKALMSGDERLMSRALEANGGRQLSDVQLKGLAGLAGDPAAQHQFLANMQKPGAAEHVQSYFMNSILSAPTSIGKVGMAGSIGNALETGLVKPLRALIDSPVAWLQSRPREFYLGETLPAMRGALDGIPQGLAKGLYMLKTGLRTEDLDAGAGGALSGEYAAKVAGKMKSGISESDIDVNDAFPKELGGHPAVQAALNMPTRFHRAATEISGTIAHQSEYFAAATREATKEAVAKGLKGAELTDYIDQRSGNLLANPSETMMTAAEKARADVTFTGKLDPQGFFGRVQHLLDWSIETKAGVVKPLKYLQPFVVVPSNIIQKGLAYSPAGFVKAAGSAGPQVSEDLARAMVGSSALVGMGTLYAGGKVWGAAPTDPAARDAFFRKNKIEYGMKIGDHAVAWDKIEPLATTMKPIFNALDAARSKDIPDDKRTNAVLKAVGTSLVDSSQTSGMYDALRALQDPGRYGKTFIARFPQAAVPYSGLMRNVAQTLDPTVRAPNTIGERVQSIIPGASQSLPAKTDLLGRPVMREGGTMQPIKYAKLTPDDPYQKTLDAAGVKLTEPGSKLGLRLLDPGTKNAYLTERGAAIRSAIDNVHDAVGEAPGDITHALLAHQIAHAEAGVREKYHGIAEAKALGLPTDDETVQRAGVLSKLPFYKTLSEPERKALVVGQ